MTIIINNQHTRGIQITMQEWKDNQWTPDWSNDFFCGSTIMVDDIDYCLEQADDWKHGIGDFLEDDVNPDDRSVEVTEMSQDDINAIVGCDVYYVADSDYMDDIYGAEYPVCLPATEVERLSAEWNVNLFERMHEASKSEIEEYGVYDA